MEWSRMIGFENEIVISKEDAVFWMDGQGRWCNIHGPFEHPKIIAYFNQAIRRDAQGYFVEQITERVREKVYFRYADTPLFLVDTLPGAPHRLLMNTGECIAMRPQDLFVARDNLYLQRGEERIKFHERLLLKLSRCIEYRESGYAIRIDDVWYPIAEGKSLPK
jgi:hypothetical protein